ncbi:MAG: orotate phosphoribosyltransferase [Firmicutes bacterium]|nr:orotate phosphoribosyltransferase [Bacillota bacterium]
MEKLRQEIRRLVFTRAYQKRKVTLASGRESDFYVDCRQVTLTSEGVYKLASYILQLIRKEGLQAKAVGGPAMGAVPLATAVSTLSWGASSGEPLDTFFVRSEPKKHGLENRVDGPTLREGLPILVLDDVLTTGGSILKTVRATRQLGCKVERIIVIVDRQEGGKENLQKEGLPVSAILTRDELVKYGAN